MNCKIGCAGVLSACVMTGVLSPMAATAGDEIFVGYGMTGEKNVSAESVVTQEDAVTVEANADLRKTGTGTWVVPSAKFAHNADATISVREGVVEVPEGGSVPAVADASDVLARAALHVVADPAKGLVLDESANGVAEWRDVRDVAGEVRTRRYFLPTWDLSRSGTVLYGKNPAYVEDAYGSKAVYFGGWNSSQAMKLMGTDGTAVSLEGVRHLFIVHSVSNSYGCTVQGANGLLTISDVFDGSREGKIFASYKQTFVNGAFTDSFANPPLLGKQLFDVRIPSEDGYTVDVNRLFCDRDVPGRFGGDYLHEIVLFTEALTAEECSKVARALMERHSLSCARPQTAFVTADRGAVSLPVEADVTRKVGSTLSVAGYGTVVKSGAGTLEIEEPKTPFEGALRMDAGAAYLFEPFALAALPGETLTMNEDAWGPRAVSVTDAPTGTFVKSGVGEVRVRSFGEGVETIRVDQGTLTVAPEASEKARRQHALEEVETISATVPHADFEGICTDAASVDLLTSYSGGQVQSKFDWSAFSTDVDGKGWLGQAFFCDWDKGTTVWTGDGNPKRPPVAPGYLALKYDVTAYTTVQIPSEGEYELTFKSINRWGLGNREMTSPVEVFVGRDANSLVRIGCYYVAQDYGWQSFRMRTPRLAAGEAQLRFAVVAKGRDNCVSIDDIALMRIPDWKVCEAYRIPCGDFEMLNAGLTDQEMYDHYNGTVKNVSGWTFAQSTAVSGVDTASTVRNGARIFAPAASASNWGEEYGSRHLVLAFADAAATSDAFVPPAGSFALKAAAANFCGLWFGWVRESGGTPNVSAKLLSEGGGVLHDFGAVSIANGRVAEIVWPTPYESDGATPVRLQLTQTTSNAVAVMDDLRLVPPEAAELIRDGSFETGDGWSALAPFDVIDYNENWPFYAEHFARTVYDGSHVARIWQQGGCQQTVTLSEAGVYRLRYHVYSRQDYLVDCGRNPVRAYLVDGNERVLDIGCTEVPFTNWVTRTFDFPVSKPGDYTLVLRGLCDGEKPYAGEDHSSLLDGVSLKRIDSTQYETLPTLSSNAVIRVAAGAKLRLDFTGTQTVYKVSLGGHSVHGVINAETYPDFVSGPGSLNRERTEGMLLMVK